MKESFEDMEYRAACMTDSGVLYETEHQMTAKDWERLEKELQEGEE